MRNNNNKYSGTTDFIYKAKRTTQTRRNAMDATEVNSKINKLVQGREGHDNTSFTAEFISCDRSTRKGLTRLTTLKQGLKPVWLILIDPDFRALAISVSASCPEVARDKIVPVSILTLKWAAETKRMTVQGSFVRRKVRCSSQVLSTCSMAFRRLTTIGSTPASPFEASLTMKERWTRVNPETHNGGRSLRVNRTLRIEMFINGD